MISKDNGKTSKEIFEEIYSHLKESKLLDKLKGIKITTCGDNKKLNLEFSNYEKCEISSHVENVFEYEFPTLLNLKNDADTFEDSIPILYLHLKSVTNNSNVNKENRKKMLDLVVGKHEECLHKIKYSNACGPNFSDHLRQCDKVIRHFSGNFWWTTAGHVKNLPQPTVQNFQANYSFLVKGRRNKNPNAPESHNQRYFAEFWISLLDMSNEQHKLEKII